MITEPRQLFVAEESCQDQGRLTTIAVLVFLPASIPSPLLDLKLANAFTKSSIESDDPALTAEQATSHPCSSSTAPLQQSYCLRVGSDAPTITKFPTQRHHLFPFPNPTHN